MRSQGNGGLTSLQKLLAMPDPLLTFKWVCTYLPFGHKLEYVESIDLPFLNVSIGDKTHMASGYIYFPGTHDISSFSMTFYEDSNGSSSKWIWGWKSKIKDFSTGLYNLPGTGSDDDNAPGFKKSIRVQLLDTANNPVISAQLIGVWPADTGNFGLNYTDTNGRVTVTQTFSVDDQKLTFHF